MRKLVVNVGAALSIPNDSLRAIAKNDVSTTYGVSSAIQYSYSYEHRNGDIKSSAKVLFSDDDEVSLIVPRNFGKLAYAISQESPTVSSYISHVTDEPIEIVIGKDLRVSKRLDTPIELATGFSLMEYQEQPVHDISKILQDSPENGCILQAPPGFGKTFILPKIIKEVGQKVLILVDRTDLVTQMHDEISANSSNLEVNILSSKNKVIRDVNVATFQFLMSNKSFLAELAKEIGFVIVDEAHVTPADRFLEVVSKLPAKYRLGLSATPTRSDGLTPMLYDVFSDNLVVAENPNNLKVQIVFVTTGHKFVLKDITKYAEEYTSFITSSGVASQVIQTVDALIAKGRKTFLYADKTKVQQFYADKLRALGRTVEIIHAKTPKKDRKRILNSFREGEIDLLISGTILQKGISLHNLDTIVNISSHTKEGYEQTVGRLRRHDENKKTPLMLDFVYGGNLRRQASVRIATAESLKAIHKDKVSTITYPQLLTKLTQE
jgi:superfamily II DNA or RNA helicase